jgi:predicted Zn-dependent peptidase
MKIVHFLKSQMPNGLTVFYAQIPESAAFELALHIDTGSRDETKETNGVSHFLEHMMFRGSKNFPDSISLAVALEDFGGECNAMTSAESTLYWLRGSTRKIIPAIEAFGDFFLHPNFADLETERSVILQELANDFNEDGENVDTDSLAMSALFQDHPLGLPIIGNEATVKSLTMAELLAKQATFYVPTNCILAVTCSLPPEKVLPQLEKIFGSAWPDRVNTPPYKRLLVEPSLYEATSLRKKNALKLQNNTDNQYALKLSFPTSGGNTRDVILQTILMRILDDGIASRLPSNVREKQGLVYDISCDLITYCDVGVFSIDATVSRDCIDKLMTTLNTELLSLLAQPPSRAELERVQFRYGFDLELTPENHGRYLGREVWNHFLGTSLTIAEEREQLFAATPQQICEIAQKVFLAPQRSFVLVGPKARKKRDEVEKFLRTLG